MIFSYHYSNIIHEAVDFVYFREVWEEEKSKLLLQKRMRQYINRRERRVANFIRQLNRGTSIV